MNLLLVNIQVLVIIVGCRRHTPDVNEPPIHESDLGDQE